MKWFWTILCIVPLPISVYFILTIEQSYIITILIIHILATVSIVICQQFWYKFQWQECKYCYQARFIHQKKHLGFPGVCTNFITKKDYR